MIVLIWLEKKELADIMSEIFTPFAELAIEYLATLLSPRCCWHVNM